MRPAAVIQWLLFLGVAAVLVYLVVYVADGWGDWVVFGGIVVTAIGGVIAYHHREYPYATKKRAFTRDSSSRW